MKILNAMLSHGPGGVQSAHVAYTKLLRHLGHDVVCCLAPRSHTVAQLPHDVRVTTLPNLFEHDPIAIARAALLLWIEKPDLVFVHGKRAMMLFSAALRLVRRRVPLVCVLHRQRFRKLAAADAIICVSDALRAEAITNGLPISKLLTIPNFLTDKAPAVRAGLWRKPPVIGFLGRLLPVKGADLLIQSLAILKSAGVPCQVRIGGDGPQRRALFQLAEKTRVVDDIQWLGWVDDLQAFYDSIDILCVPSRIESFGLVILDAFSSGKPVVATHNAGPASIIADKQNGILVGHDAREIANALKVLIENPGLGARLAAQAALDLDRYRLDAVAPKVQVLLESLMAGAKLSAEPVRSNSAIDAAN